MSGQTVIIKMKNGDTHHIRGYVSEISPKINEARGKGHLLDLERDTIPTGEMMSIDPDEVSSVRNDR